MTGGLKTTGRLAIAAMFCAIGSMPGAGGQAEAADLGGDCCADLEERVAELEATTVRKGNKKVKVELYGRVNRVINFWDRCYGASDQFNCSTRRNGVNYSSPDWQGFNVQWGWFEDDDWGTALRYKNTLNDTWKLSANVACENSP